jgi:phosphonoacetaldehyde hydrolase
MNGASTGVSAVVFDWAGTVIDFGSHAPMGAFVELFARHGVAISVAEARKPMGLPKWHHIQALGQQPRIAQAWRDAHRGRSMDDADVDALYAEFTPMNIESAQENATIIPGTTEVVGLLREQGIKIGSTTGYNREIMQLVAPLAHAQGFTPENLVCAGDVPLNRPTPLGMYRSFLDLAVWPASSVVKVDDTVPGLLEGRNAGCWTVAVLASGNELGLTHEQWSAADSSQKAQWRQAAREGLAAADADFHIDTVADLLPVISSINERLFRGERPRI